MCDLLVVCRVDVGRAFLINDDDVEWKDSVSEALECLIG